MDGEVIQFPGARRVETEARRTPTAIFKITEDGQVDLVDGLKVTDAVDAFWTAVQDVVREAWADSPLAAERARTRLLSAYLDRVRPGWRQEVSWF